jgi:hypothetical protein
VAKQTKKFGYADTVVLVLVVWAVLAYLFHLAGVRDVVEIFPLSIFFGPEIQWNGLPFAALFLGVLWLAYRMKLDATRVWILGIALIVLGNLAQGGIHPGLIRPVYVFDRQYYNDAVQIGNAGAWLRAFTERQASFNVHSSTHPPFAVLLHHVLGTKQAIATVFILIASLSVPLLRSVLKTVGTDEERATTLALLFAVIPSVNLYSAVTLDAVIMTVSLVFLLGFVGLVQKVPWQRTALVLFCSGLLVMNILTFGGLFLVAVAAIWSVRNSEVRRALLISLAGGAALYLIFRFGLGYDHVRAFLNASRIENPDGFRLLAMPGHYALTRIENVGNLLFFMSVPVLAVFLRQKHDRLTLTAMLVLGAMFLSGAFRTGETSRACLYMYPYLFLSLRHVRHSVLRWLVLGAGAQTALMQVVGVYAW